MALLRRIADAVGARTADQADRLAVLGVGTPTEPGTPGAVAPAAASGAPTTPRRLLEWQIATVKTITTETARAKTFTLELPDWQPHRAGQHYDVRLTAADGYQAERSYSIASEPERTGDDIIYRAELDRLAGGPGGSDGAAGPGVFYTLTRGAPDGWSGFARRIDADMLREVLGPLGLDVRVFVCGPTLLVESVADSLVEIGIPADRIKTERFGPTGS
jgi:ferredoxin-NADP reductase